MAAWPRVRAAVEAAAEDAGEIVMVCHSHPFASPQPSAADRAMCELTRLPWLIVNHPLGDVCAFVPIGYRTPLLGRPFVHGVHDCYSLIRDHYAWELGIELPDFPRAERWWEQGGEMTPEDFGLMRAQRPNRTIIENGSGSASGSSSASIVGTSSSVSVDFVLATVQNLAPAYTVNSLVPAYTRIEVEPALAVDSQAAEYDVASQAADWATSRM